jgi:hypothetical protein
MDGLPIPLPTVDYDDPIQTSSLGNPSHHPNSAAEYPANKTYQSTKLAPPSQINTVTQPMIEEIKPLGANRGSYLEYRLHLRKIRKRMTPRKHLHNQTPQTPNIRLPSITRLLHHLRRHPIHTPLQTRSMRMMWRRCRQQIRLYLLRDAEIGDFDDSLVIDEDVGAFDVAVDDVPFVQVV